MFKPIDGLQGIKAALYVFHDPADNQPGHKRMRASTAAYLTSTGELFIGCSCASESDQFTRAKGRMQAQSEALAKLMKWAHKSPKVKPDDLILVDGFGCDDKGVWIRGNKAVQDACLRYQLERFRLLLARRHDIIEKIGAVV